MKQLYFLIFCLFISIQVWGQGSSIQSKITLNTGVVFTGEIVIKTNEMVMIKTSGGKRYQFLLSEIKKIENISDYENSDKPNKANNFSIENTAVFCGNIEFSGAVVSASNSFKSSPGVDLSMVFGNKKNLLSKNVFVGIGAGYDMIFLTSSITPISYLPLFIRFQSTLNKSRTAPFLGIDAGYSFGLTSGFGGGPSIKISVGVIHKTGFKSDVYAGVFGGLTSVSTRLTETNELGTFIYTGNTSMTKLGLKLGFHF